jgi:hypothetical protein
LGPQQRLPELSLHARKTIREQPKTQARRRTTGLMQGWQAIFGSLRKHLCRCGKTLDAAGQDQNQLAQPKRAHSRRDGFDPRRIYRI